MDLGDAPELNGITLGLEAMGSGSGFGMLEKIISGGQTGADRAALDAAIKFCIPHGGWIPRGRKTESGPLPAFYELQETETPDYRERTRKNILDSHGTVIFTRGGLTGGSKLTENLARKHGMPHCHIDLVAIQGFGASMALHSFVMENHIGVLNVAGSRESHDFYIYVDVKTVMETFLFLVREEPGSQEIFPKDPCPEVSFPQTLEESARMLASDLPLKTLVHIARMPWIEMGDLYHALLETVRIRTGLEQGNPLLLKACASASHIPAQWFTPEDGIMEILKEVKRMAEQEYQLTVVR